MPPPLPFAAAARALTVRRPLTAGSAVRRGEVGAGLRGAAPSEAAGLCGSVPPCAASAPQRPRQVGARGSRAALGPGAHGEAAAGRREASGQQHPRALSPQGLSLAKAGGKQHAFCVFLSAKSIGFCGAAPCVRQVMFQVVFLNPKHHNKACGCLKAKGCLFIVRVGVSCSMENKSA